MAHSDVQEPHSCRRSLQNLESSLKRTRLIVLDGQSPGFGALLKRLRVDAGLSQEELAKRARISPQAVGAYERGVRRAPHRETFALLVEALGVCGERYDELARAAERGRLRGPELPPRHNLPLPMTALIGRDAVVADVRGLIAGARLVTLSGTGGIGKTRTALEVAWSLVDGFRDGVWFAELAAVGDQALVAGTIAFALGLAQQADQPVLETLQRRLCDKELLLVLDNCEHLIEETVRVAEALLRACPAVKVLATSREVLRIAGERIYRVPSLDVPASATLSAAESVEYGAIALFAECAGSSDRSFALTDQNASFVAEICRRLDGIPLAIELAAARMTALAPAQLVNELDGRFRVLAGGRRTALPRQKTMRALIDWSYDLLTKKEQRILRRLSVFAGGWTLPAAAAVCADATGAGPEAVQSAEVFDIVSSLIDKSLVVALSGGEERRYRFLESTRAYAAEKLDRAGERAEITRRHVEFVASFAAAALSIDQYGRRMALLRADIENIRSALAWCLASDGTVGIAARILRDARAFLSQNLREEFVTQTREVLKRGKHLGRELTAEMLVQISVVTVGSESLDVASRAADLLEEGGLRTGVLVRAYQRKSFALAQLRRVPEALEANRIALELHRELGVTDPQSLGSLHFGQGYLLNYQWRLKEAREAWEKARDLFVAIGDAAYAARAEANIAEALFLDGDVEGAVRLALACLEVCRREDLAYLEALTLNNLAAYRLYANDRRNAARDLIAAAGAARRAGDDGLMIARAVRHAAALSVMQDDFESAGELLGYSAAWFEARGFYDPGDGHQFERLEALLCERLSVEGFRRLFDAGAKLSEDQAWEKALSVIRLADD